VVANTNESKRAGGLYTGQSDVSLLILHLLGDDRTGGKFIHVLSKILYYSRENQALYIFIYIYRYIKKKQIKHLMFKTSPRTNIFPTDFVRFRYLLLLFK
jgi:hypothetical protein